MEKKLYVGGGGYAKKIKICMGGSAKKIKYVRGGRRKKYVRGGGVRKIFHSAPHLDFKWNSPKAICLCNMIMD